jgi:hypothetical protein
MGRDPRRPGIVSALREFNFDRLLLATGQLIG